MTITIDDKYLDISEKGRKLAYFEHFECKEHKRSVIKISVEDKEGDVFLKYHDSFICTRVEIRWFDKKPIFRDVLFVRQKGDFSYIILFDYYE